MASKTSLLMILCALSVFQTSAQTEKKIKYRNNILGISLFEYHPISAISTINYNIENEFLLKENKAILVNLGYIHSYKDAYILPTGFAWSHFNGPTQGFRIQTEYKEYFGKHKIFAPACLLFWPHVLQFFSEKAPHSGYYHSLHTHFRYLVINASTPFRSAKFGQEGSWLNAGFNYKVGYRSIYKCGLSFDYSVGAGVQYVEKKNVDDELGLLSPIVDWSDLYPSVAYQFKIGWGYNKKAKKKGNGVIQL